MSSKTTKLSPMARELHSNITKTLSNAERIRPPLPLQRRGMTALTLNSPPLEGWQAKPDGVVKLTNEAN
jgi:hypothetical protein